MVLQQRGQIVQIQKRGSGVLQRMDAHGPAPQRRIQHHGDRAGRRPEGPQRRHLSRQQAQKPLQVCGVRKSQRTACLLYTSDAADDV